MAKKIICPKCKSENIIPILYGYPGPDAEEAAGRGEIKLGGCMINVDGCDMPDRFCRDCEHEWSVDHFVAEDIVKVRFRYWSNWGYFDPAAIKEDQWAYEVYPDGTIKYYSYPRRSRKVLDKDVTHISEAQVKDFYNQVIWLYRPWTQIEEYRVCDGCSYELTITYKDNRQRKFTGDIAGGTVDEIVMEFIKSIPDFKYLFEDED